MPTLHIQGKSSFDVPHGQRLVRAIEDNGVDIGHRCGGKARCTTCRVRFVSGEPETMTRAERDKLKDRGLLGDVRLSCQIRVEVDMDVAVLMLASENGWSDPGPEPDPMIEPEPEWITLSDALED